MKRLGQIVLVFLIVLGLSTAVVKLVSMPEEMTLFAKVGFSAEMTKCLGMVQLLGTGLLVRPATRVLGALVLLLSFVLGTYALFVAQEFPFAPISILFIAMAGFVAWSSKPLAGT